MVAHALVTGTGIAGRIPVPSDDHPEPFVDVTPDVLYFEHDDPETPPPAMVAVADAIEAEHYFRGTHPVQVACRALDDPEQYPDVPDELRQAHREQHAALRALLEGK
jgi:hypothetical protein